MSDFDPIRIGRPLGERRELDEEDSEDAAGGHGGDGEPLCALIMSDSHGDERIVRSLILSFRSRVDLIVHLGDGVADLSVALAGLKRPPAYEFVCGAGEEPAERRAPRVITGGGLGVFVSHGHDHGVREGPGRLCAAAAARGCAVALFGHTHEAFLETIDGILLINPGSVGKPKRPEFPTCALLRLADGRAEVEHWAVRPGLLRPRLERWYAG